ncbi:hypothetical protein SAY86_029645 [Trapa natans]|uniref:Transcription repressor n=1 Tax=Trapa natans TaxID=22666 RepID=A0AAN7M2I6_TRANT|nr:hypothetical protein SAY86_029645 [Trapa natans]
MGNRHRFKLSDMMPNAWFYKLRDMRRASSTAANHNPSGKFSKTSTPSGLLSSMKATPTTIPPHVKARKTYYFPRDLSSGVLEPPPQPLRSSKQAPPPPSRKLWMNTKPGAASPPLNKQVSLSSGSFSNRASTDSVWTRTEDADSPDSIFDDGSSPELRIDRVLTPESFHSRRSMINPPSTIDYPDIAIHIDEDSFTKKPERPKAWSHNLDSSPNIELPRIITKPSKNSRKAAHVELEAAEREEKKTTEKNARKANRENGAGRRRPPMSSSPRPRLKIKSPRLAGKRLPEPARRTRAGTAASGSSSSVSKRKLSGSLAVVKSSFDPQRDFRDSVVKMIVELNIKATKDLEELLACYLSLNSEEYHDLIIQVFKQIWFDLSNTNSSSSLQKSS